MRTSPGLPIDEVIVAEPRGFCAGVEMAVRSLAWMVRLYGAPVYCVHEIVHNRLVVEAFEAVGVVFVDDITQVPAGRPVMLSAHGSAPEVVASAHAAGGVVVDAVCPLVAKVHHEVRSHAARSHVVLHVGHSGHDEVEAVRRVAPAATLPIGDAADAIAALAQLDPATPIALLAQTTLAVDEWADALDAVRRSRPDVMTPRHDDLCYATTNRQAAVRELAAACDAVIVVGSANSSNTVALTRVAADAGCPIVQRVDTADDLDLAAFADCRSVGVTAGASAPERAVRGVVARLRPSRVTRRATVTEDEYFPPPPALRSQIAAVSALVAASLFAPAACRGEDRDLAAADVLAGLAAVPLLPPHTPSTPHPAPPPPRSGTTLRRPVPSSASPRPHAVAGGAA